MKGMNGDETCDRYAVRGVDAYPRLSILAAEPRILFIQRIAFRVDSEQKDLIERGAEARGLTVTDYVKTLAIKDAEQALVERTFFTVSAEAYDQFVAILDRPVQPNPLLGKQVQKSKASRWKLKS